MRRDQAARRCPRQARHDADYDHLAVVSKATAFAAIIDATEAIEGLAAASDRDGQAFFALISLRPACADAPNRDTGRHDSSAAAHNLNPKQVDLR